MLASSDCPCLTSLAALGMPGDKIVEIAGRSYNYGPSYGLSCGLHDAKRPPSCGGDDGVCGSHRNNDPWCYDAWCYVNASECSLASAQTGRTGRHMLVGLDPVASTELHYSYATCGNLDDYHVLHN